MQLYWTIAELMHLTRRELCELSERMREALADLEAGSRERIHVVDTLDNIRRVLALRAPRHP